MKARSPVLAGLLGLFSAATFASAADTPWSFAPLVKPKPPQAKNLGWLKDGVDLFLLAKMEEKGVAPNRDADRVTLLRRATYDLTGLPPTADEIDSFVRDGQDDDRAFARVLDRLLASPRFGERWARHWLDVARYADSVGRTMNAVFPYAFQYRDYVIEALNADKPYNRFIAEQVAGDLLPARTIQERREALTATGFLTFGALDLTNRGEQFVLDRVDDQIDVTTRAFLGLTIACARCHDHPTDPVTQRDYYALAGIFLSTKTWTGQVDGDGLGANGYVDEDNLLRLPADTTPAHAKAGGASSNKSGSGGGATMGGAMMMEEPPPSKGYPTRFRWLPNRAMGVEEGEPQDCESARKGDPFDRGEAPPRGSIAIPGLPKIEKIPTSASGRLELARWLVRADNPLTARVAVNRVWQHLFGQGLVRTVDDFGITGEKPTNAALLDHLATRFVEGGWSMKKLIRAVMLSRAYRLSSEGNAVARKIDPGNELHWRMSPRRLELEPLRDSMLLVAGRLTFDRPPGIQVAGFGGKGREAWTRSLLPETSPYRSIFLPALRSKPNALHEIFDFPDPSQIKGQREVTTVAGQALFFMNSEFASDVAADAAARLLEEKAREDDARIELAYTRVLARRPTREETADARAFLAGLDFAPQKKWAAFIQALIAGAEFRYVL